MKKLISGAYTFGLTVKGTGRTYFPNIASLREKRIKHIIVSSNGNGYSYFSFIEKNTQLELLKNVPEDVLTWGDAPLFVNKVIDLVNSFVDHQTVNPNTEITYTITCMYDEPKVWGKIPEKKNRTEVYTLELPIKSKKTFFSDDKYLKGKQIQNIILSRQQLSPVGNTNLFDLYNYRETDQQRLTLIKNTNEVITKLPFSFLVQTDSDTPLRLQNIQFDLMESYVEILDFDETMIDKSIILTFIVDDNKN